MFGRYIAITFGLTLLASLAQAEESQSAFQYIFREGTLANLKEGDTISYLQTRNDPAQNLNDQTMDLELDARTAEDVDITLRDGEKSQHLGTYPKSVGNPVHMYFLEKIIADMAADTGGSPFYIRNRLKDALGGTPADPQECVSADGAAMAGECIVLQPFAKDEARDKMEEFADLQITFHLDEASPAWILGIDATNPKVEDGYHFSLEIE